MTNRWLSRLCYSFFVIAAVLAYEIYRVNSGQKVILSWQYTLMCIGAVMALGLGIVGIRARHRVK
ncbi:MAG: hypothetical protein IT448_00785 [Phycisphaerales bacterium]|nr:hypothetical protein [Phycisphaerales bacterium]